MAIVRRRAYALLAAVLALLCIIQLFSPPAFASNSDGPSSPRAFDLVLNSWPVLLAAGVGFVSSQLTAVFTHHKAPQWIKSLTNLFFTSLGGVIITVQTVPGHTWKDYAGVIVAGELAALATHYVGATALLQNATATFGVGGSSTPLVPPTGTTLTDTTLQPTDVAGTGGVY